MAQETFMELAGVSVGYGTTRVLEGIDLAIGEGEFVALLGSSGCGKTTLLRAIAGFVAPNAGSIRVAGRDLTRLPPDQRGMALVFQSYALWPHMTVAQNIGYGLKLQRRTRDEVSRRVAELEEMLGLSGLSGRKPAALSGGQRQRVALGRALAIDPKILLLDEPLSNLDARIRLAMRHEIRALQKRLGITAIHVTHDREEAMVMADRIIILNGGRIAQQGVPEEVYNRPASSFIAAFMGAENTLTLSGRPIGDRFQVAAGTHHAACSVALQGRALKAGTVEARFRTESATLVTAEGPASGGGEGTTFDALDLFGVVESVSYPGGCWRHTVRVGDALILADASSACAPGTSVRVRIPEDALFLFNRQAADAHGAMAASFAAPVPAVEPIAAARCRATGEYRTEVEAQPQRSHA
ncbi:MAG TPA: ABC transporter ATP-binding protein [Dongiaceae bacterium]|nr:ABC transporter ATP-binding protein [Dongiaceae bacterium]